MIIDGRVEAQMLIDALGAQLAQAKLAPTLSILSVAPNFATKKYLAIKQRTASTLGIGLQVIERGIEATTESLLEDIAAACAITNGIILQLPFPVSIDTEQLLRALPREKDVDAIGLAATEALTHGDATVLPPVVGAIQYLAKKYAVSFSGANVVVIGEGRLVGKPAALWARQQGAQVRVLTSTDSDIAQYTKDADILILGTGKAGLITPSMIKEGVALFDAGTSEEDGKLVGDALAACAVSASLFTPVPGGIGPITIARLFENLTTLTKK